MITSHWSVFQQQQIPSWQIFHITSRITLTTWTAVRLHADVREWAVCRDEVRCQQIELVDLELFLHFRLTVFTDHDGTAHLPGSTGLGSFQHCIQQYHMVHRSTYSELQAITLTCNILCCYISTSLLQPCQILCQLSFISLFHDIWEFVYFVWCLSPPKRRVVQWRNYAHRRVTTTCRTCAGFYVYRGHRYKNNDIFLQNVCM